MGYPEDAAETGDPGANRRKTTRLGDFQPDDFDDAEATPSSAAHALSDITRHGVLTVGLEEIDERGEVALHAIITDEFHIGRLESCNLALWSDTKVSRRHARIYREGEDFMLQDNGSSNGTLLNGEKLEFACRLQAGDRIVIGRHKFTFVRRVDTNTRG